MYPLRKMLVSTMLLAGLGLAGALPAHATLTFSPGNHPQPDEENILLNDGTTGNPVFGMTNMSGITVGFSSTTDMLTEPASGQARVGSTDQSLNELNIYIPGGDYLDLIINPFLGDNPDGPATVNVTTNMGGGSFVYSLSNGNNFLTIFASGGEKIFNTEIIAPNGMD